MASLLARFSMVALLLVASCAHGPPAWVQAGSHTRTRTTFKVWYGVGVARQVRNPAHARAVAENRARHQVLALLETDPGGASTRAGVLWGVRIVDHWVARDGRVYALARFQP